MNGKGKAEENEASPLEELGKVQPGDVVDVWLEETYLVKTVLLCHETVDDRTYEWRWIFLDDGSLIEVSPDGYFRYKEHHVLKQGTSEYETLVAQDGALVRFEERVREGTSGRRPVQVTIGGSEYRITGTGTAEVQRLGDEPAPEPWQTLSAEAKENVYFGMVVADDETQVALGLWTTHVCLSTGRALDPTNISAVYRK